MYCNNYTNYFAQILKDSMFYEDVWQHKTLDLLLFEKYLKIKCKLNISIHCNFCKLLLSHLYTIPSLTILNIKKLIVLFPLFSLTSTWIPQCTNQLQKLQVFWRCIFFNFLTGEFIVTRFVLNKSLLNWWCKYLKHYRQI